MSNTFQEKKGTPNFSNYNYKKTSTHPTRSEQQTGITTLPGTKLKSNILSIKQWVPNLSHKAYLLAVC